MNILIIDDHVVMRKGLKTLASGLANVQQIDEATSADEGLQFLKKNKYDLLVLDLHLPDRNGLDVLQYIKDCDIGCQIIVISFHPEEHFARQAFNLGASGYISKSASYDEIRLAIQKVAGGGKYVPARYAEKIAFGKSTDALPHEVLSERELQVMLYLAGGKTIAEISNALHIADKTVSTYRARILDKMGMKNNAELTIYALNNKLIV